MTTAADNMGREASRTRDWRWAAVAGVVALLVGAGWAALRLPAHQSATAGRHAARTADGAATAASIGTALQQGGQALGKSDLGAAQAAYQQAYDRARSNSTPDGRRQAAEATFGLAYVKAFHKDFAGARKLFAAAKRAVPGKGSPGSVVSSPWSVVPLDERAAYQEAVCVAAAQGKVAGIAAYEAFIERYPYSTLIHGAVLRVRRLNGSGSTPRCERLWKRATGLQAKRQREERVAASQCGPECLAAALAHYGITASAKDLAREAGTDQEGTSMEALARAARKRGLSAVGLRVGSQDLRRQPLPAIALTGMHYVLVEGVDRRGLDIRDGQARKRVAWSEWNRQWGGVLLRLAPRS